MDSRSLVGLMKNKRRFRPRRNPADALAATPVVRRLRTARPGGTRRLGDRRCPAATSAAPRGLSEASNGSVRTPEVTSTPLLIRNPPARGRRCSIP
jgi:hypothetical protein